MKSLQDKMPQSLIRGAEISAGWGEDEKRFFNLFALAALALIALPVGIACLVLGFGMGDSPCIMCWHERFCMVAISFVALLIVRYGFTVKYLAAILFLACLGLYDGFYTTALTAPAAATSTSSRASGSKF